LKQRLAASSKGKKLPDPTNLLSIPEERHYVGLKKPVSPIKNKNIEEDNYLSITKTSTVSSKTSYISTCSSSSSPSITSSFLSNKEDEDKPEEKSDDDDEIEEFSDNT
jgi:hypothetical protein